MASNNGTNYGNYSYRNDNNFYLAQLPIQNPNNINTRQGTQTNNRNTKNVHQATMQVFTQANSVTEMQIQNFSIPPNHRNITFQSTDRQVNPPMPFVKPNSVNVDPYWRPPTKEIFDNCDVAYVTLLPKECKKIVEMLAGKEQVIIEKLSQFIYSEMFNSDNENLDYIPVSEEERLAYIQVICEKIIRITNLKSKAVDIEIAKAINKFFQQTIITIPDLSLMNNYAANQQESFFRGISYTRTFNKEILTVNNKEYLTISKSECQGLTDFLQCDNLKGLEVSKLFDEKFQKTDEIKQNLQKVKKCLEYIDDFYKLRFKLPKSEITQEQVLRIIQCKSETIPLSLADALNTYCKKIIFEFPRTRNLGS